MIPEFLTILSGIIVGLILWVIGGGGSIIAVPLLLYVVGMPSAHAAIGTGAIAVALSALSSLVISARRGLIKWPCGLMFAGSGIIGSYAGSQLALQVPGAKIIALFGGLMLVVGTLMLMQKNAEGDSDVRLTLKTAKRMGPWIIGSGIGVGGLAGFFGIGGGFLIVPALIMATSMPITHAIATSLIGITAFGFVTAATYALSGAINWLTVVYFVIGGAAGSMLGHLLGAKLAQRKKHLQGLFGVAVIVVGAFTLYRSLP